MISVEYKCQQSLLADFRNVKHLKNQHFSYSQHCCFALPLAHNTIPSGVVITNQMSNYTQKNYNKRRKAIIKVATYNSLDFKKVNKMAVVRFSSLLFIPFANWYFLSNPILCQGFLTNILKGIINSFSKPYFIDSNPIDHAWCL